MREAKTCSEALYGEVSKLHSALRSEQEKPLPKRNPVPFEEALPRVAEAAYPEPGTGKKLIVLSTRLAKRGPDYLTCLRRKEIPPGNNRAERLLRPQIIMHKVFGGCRSEKGAENHA